MSIAERKQSIIAKLDKIEDEAMLNYIDSTVNDIAISRHALTVDNLSEEQTFKLYKAIRQADAGMGIPHNEVMQKAKQWLGK